MKNYILILFVLSLQTSYAQKLHKEYYDNGQLKAVGYYDENGKETGEWQLYYLNGNLHKKGKYHKGKAQGEWRIYYDNGQLKETGSFKKNKTHGEWKVYHKNGKIKRIGRYKNGKTKGEWRIYDENGDLKGVRKHWSWEWGGAIGDPSYFQNEK